MARGCKKRTAPEAEHEPDESLEQTDNCPCEMSVTEASDPMRTGGKKGKNASSEACMLKSRGLLLVTWTPTFRSLTLEQDQGHLQCTEWGNGTGDLPVINEQRLNACRNSEAAPSFVAVEKGSDDALMSTVTRGDVMLLPPAWMLMRELGTRGLLENKHTLVLNSATLLGAIASGRSTVRVARYTVESANQSRDVWVLSGKEYPSNASDIGFRFENWITEADGLLGAAPEGASSPEPLVFREDHQQKKNFLLCKIEFEGNNQSFSEEHEEWLSQFDVFCMSEIDAIRDDHPVEIKTTSKSAVNPANLMQCVLSGCKELIHCPIEETGGIKQISRNNTEYSCCCECNKGFPTKSISRHLMQVHEVPGKQMTEYLNNCKKDRVDEKNTRASIYDVAKELPRHGQQINKIVSGSLAVLELITGQHVEGGSCVSMEIQSSNIESVSVVAPAASLKLNPFCDPVDSLLAEDFRGAFNAFPEPDKTKPVGSFPDVVGIARCISTWLHAGKYKNVTFLDIDGTLITTAEDALPEKEDGSPDWIEAERVNYFKCYGGKGTAKILLTQRQMQTLQRHTLVVFLSGAPVDYERAYEHKKDWLDGRCEDNPHNWKIHDFTNATYTPSFGDRLVTCTAGDKGDIIASVRECLVRLSPNYKDVKMSWVDDKPTGTGSRTRHTSRFGESFVLHVYNDPDCAWTDKFVERVYKS